MDEKFVIQDREQIRIESNLGSPSPPTDFEHVDTSRSGRSKKSSRSRFSSSSRRLQGQPASWPDPCKYEARTLYILTLQNPIRQGLIFAIENPLWDRIVLLIILINTVSLIARDPYDVEQFQPESKVRTAWEVLSTVSVILHFRVYRTFVFEKEPG
jgi:hypothetical protein